MWIGTEDAGLNKLNLLTKQITHYKPTGEPGSIANSNIHGLLVVKDELWIGTFEHGLDVMDITTGKVKKHYAAGPNPNDLKSDFIVCLLLTKKGEIYVGSSNGLYRYNNERDNFTPIKGIAEGTFISCLLEDEEGIIWVGTHDSGIFFYNPVTAHIGNLKNEPGNKNSLTTNSINAVYQDSFYSLWFATDGGGLCQLTDDKKQFKRYTTKDGFISNFVFKVLEDSKRTLWITTSRGLVN
ncbi:MAG: hybrid sensor histidine kinase/response regulator, partial [Sphingobacteriaceae bacterium]